MKKSSSSTTKRSSGDETSQPPPLPMLPPQSTTSLAKTTASASPKKRASSKKTSSSSSSSSSSSAMNIPTMKDIIEGVLVIPDSVMRNYVSLENDIAPDQQAEYPDMLDPAQNMHRMGGNGDDQSMLDDPNCLPCEEVTDYTIRDEEIKADHLISGPKSSSCFFGVKFCFRAGDVWPVVQPGQKVHCMYDGGKLKVGTVIIMHPEEWNLQMGEWKCWGSWCSDACWARWLIESWFNNKTHYQLSMANLLLAIFGREVETYPAPTKYGVLRKFGGTLSIEEFRAIRESGITADTTLITNGMFTPASVTIQIERLNAQIKQVANETLESVLGVDRTRRNKDDDDDDDDEDMEQVRQVLEGSLSLYGSTSSSVNPGVWVDPVTQKWVDIHNLPASIASQYVSPNLTPGRR